MSRAFTPRPADQVFAPRTASAPLRVERDPDRIVGVGITVVAVALVAALLAGVIVL